MKREILDLILDINIFKTIFLNFYYFPLNIAIKIPIVVFRKTILKKVSGKIILNCDKSEIKTGMLRFGPCGVGTIDYICSHSIWELYGKLIISGKTTIGRGTKLCIGENAKLVLGKNLLITGNTSVICQKEISIGDDSLLSWDILIMDSDFHDIMDSNDHIINNPREIRIGHHVWIGCRTTILKGVHIGDNNIIAAGSIVSRSFNEASCTISAHGREVNVLKREVKWSV